MHHPRLMIAFLALPLALSAGVAFESTICPGHNGTCSTLDQSASGGDSLTAAVLLGQFTGSTIANLQPGSIGVESSIQLTNYRPAVTDGSAGDSGEAHIAASTLDTLTVSAYCLPSIT